MTFLNPLVLFGLAAAAIPLLLHLFNLRKLRKIEFSTLSFLKELQKTKIRRLKIRQLLLLILRTLLIIFVVLAFSRPTLQGSIAAGFGTRAKTTAVFIVDNSLSMTGSDERGELIRQAKESALKAVDLLKEGDEAFLVLLSEARSSASLTSGSSTKNLMALKSAVRDIRPSSIHRSLEDALRLAAKLLSGSSNYNKEVYVFSDFQSGLMTDQEDVEQPVETLFPGEVRFYFIRLGNRSFQNLGITSVSIPNAIFEPGRSFSVQARISNFGSTDVRDHVVSIFLNGIRIAQRGFDVPSEKSTDVEFQVTPSASGFLEGFIELEDDDLQYDNRRHFTIRIPDKISVLLVGSASELRYVRLALETQRTDGGSSLDLRETRVNQFSANQLNALDVVLLASAVGLSTVQVDQLATFVRAGGGLVFFPTSRDEASVFNTTIASSLKLPAMVGIEGSASKQSAGQNESFVEFEKVETQHPLFLGMFEEPSKQRIEKPQGVRTQRSIESPRIRTSIPYAASSRSLPIISLSNGTTFLLEQPVGDGRAFLFSVAPNLDWSDFPVRGIFVPLLHRSVIYLSQGQQQNESEIAGDDHLIRSRIRGAEQWMVENPEKVKIALTGSRTTAERSAHFSETEALGVYVVRAGNVVIQKFAVNLDPSESDITPAREKQTEEMLRRLGISTSSVTTITESQETQRTVLQSRFGVELWKHFLIVALLLAFAETIVARETRRSMTREAAERTHSESHG